MSEQPQKRLITDKTLRQWLGGISVATLWRMERDDPEFPRKVKVRGLNCRDEDEAREYIERLIERSGRPPVGGETP